VFVWESLGVKFISKVCNRFQSLWSPYTIIIDKNRSRIYTSSSTDKSAELAITSYLVYLIREEVVEQIFFLLIQHVAESCTISKSFGDIIRLLANIQNKWLESCLEKLKLLKNRNIYKVVDFFKRSKVIENCWVFNIKSDSHYRSQLVTKWFSQVEEIDFDKLFSLFVCYETAHLFIVVVVLEYCDIYTIDVKTAYLYGDLNKEVYIEQPEDFKLLSKEKKVWWLHKALYSLKQASLSWW